MDHSETRIRAAGTTLAAGGLLLAVVLALHGPLQPTIADQMQAIEHREGWSPLHWIAAAALSLFAAGALIALTSGSRLTDTVATTIAWAVVAIGAVWTLMTAAIEATAVTYAANLGNQQLFEAWWALAEGLANGFAFLALGIAVIAGHESRSSDRVMPVWLSWIGVFAGIASFAGWGLGSWFGVPLGSLLWVASSLVMCLWLASFGLALAWTRNTSGVAIRQH